jgi:hypothetical protein
MCRSTTGPHSGRGADGRGRTACPGDLRGLRGYVVVVIVVIVVVQTEATMG